MHYGVYDSPSHALLDLMSPQKQHVVRLKK